MKKILSVWISACLSAGAMAQSALAFDANAGVKSKMTVYDGTEVGYTAYERLFYVTNVEDSTYQFLNVYVPDGATQQTPIFLRTYVGGYMASPAAQPQVGEYITDLDMQKYLNYVVSTQALKGVPAFDSQIEGINNASGENEEFGDANGSSVNFTDYTAQKNGTTLSDAIRQNVRLMNPMSFIGDGKTTIAPHWYIRHGARDRDTAFPVPLNFATKLQNAGKDVNFLLAWNRPHSGDYALDELFEWMNKITK